MSKMLFEKYLEDKWAETYLGTDDDMPDNFEKWLAMLEPADLIELGNKAMASQKNN